MWVGAMHKVRILALTGALGLATGPVLAAPQTVTTTFNVTATVLNNCAVSASDLAFGNYSASSGSPVTATTTLSVTCTASLGYTIALDGGTTTGVVAARAMKDTNSNQLNYGLYTSGAYSTVWGDGTGGSQIYRDAAPAPNSNISVPIYGCLRAGQRGAMVGSYQETFAVTVNF